MQADEHETDELNLEEYNLDYLTQEELEALKTVLGNLKEADVIDEEKMDAIINDLQMDEEEEDTESENFGQNLSSSIKGFKNENTEWTGEQLTNRIQNFIINNREDIVPEEAKNKIKEAKEKKEQTQQNKGGESGDQGKNDSAENKGNGGY
ncbi:MAG: hypothetical protein K9K32_07165 [Halanaerobiales bacterium]|nr:hypothetical protein [Halanaerobiales bacterium]